MSASTIVLHSIITGLFGLFAVLGMFFPFCKKRKSVDPVSLKNEDSCEDETSENSEDGFKTKEISFKSTLIYSSISFVMIILIGMWTMFFFHNEDIIYLAKRVLLISVLFVAAYYDYASLRIPNKLILYGICVRLVLLVFELIFARDTLSQVLISEGVAFIAMLVLSIVSLLITRNGLGMGDIKLFLLMSLLQGVAGVISSLFTSLIVSFIYSLGLLALKKKSRKDFIAFAPCILIGTYLSVMMLGA